MQLAFTERDCLEWAVAEQIGIESFQSRISGGQPLRIKFGIDPTSQNIHLGRSIPLWRLRAFQELGHEIHLIIGNFTAQIGDTSDKESERPMLTAEQVQHNLEPYLEQLWQILNPLKKEQVHMHYNADWLAKLSLSELGELADSFSVNTFIKRELIAKRLESGSRVSLREMLYPLMQGYDSLMVKAEIEIGGTDQRFNLLAGRTLQERRGLPPQAIILNPLIAGSDGRKMSSSWGNVISLLDSPTDKFGKLMSIADSLLVEYLTFLPYAAQPFSALELTTRLSNGENPRDLKLQLAFALVALYHGEDVAAAAQSAFTTQFGQHLPTTEIGLSSSDLPLPLIDIIDRFTVWDESRSELRRVFQAGGIQVNDEKQTDPQQLLTLADLPAILRVGKKILVRLVQAL